MLVVPIKFDAVETVDNIIDIASSGAVGDVTDSCWKVESIEGLVNLLSDKQKQEVWVNLKSAMECSEGWSLTDVRYFKEILGVKGKCLV